MDKTQNNSAFFMVLPVLFLAAFWAIIPLMTVVRHAFNDTFGSNVVFWIGFEWFEDVFDSDRMPGHIAAASALWLKGIYVEKPDEMATPVHSFKRRLEEPEDKARVRPGKVYKLRELKVSPDL